MGNEEEVQELACVYAALILQDDDVAVTGEKIQTLLKASKVNVEPFWPGLFAKALDGVDIKGLITSVSSGVGAGPTATAGDASSGAAAKDAPAAEDKPAKKEEKEEEESDEDMGFGLFD